MSTTPIQLPALEPPKYYSPFDARAKLMNLQNLAQQQQEGQQNLQLGQMKLAEGQRKVAEGQQLRDLFQNTPDLRSALPGIYKINPELGISMTKSLHEQEKSAIDMETSRIANSGKKAERLASLAGSAKDEDSYHRAITKALDEGLISAQEAQEHLAKGWGPQSQAEMQQAVQMGLDAKEQGAQRLAQLKEYRDALTAKHNQEMAPFQLTQAQETARKTTLEADELQRKLDMIKNTKPSDVLALVDQVVPPDVKANHALSMRTKAMVVARLQQGDIAGAQDAIKTAAAEMRQLEVATDPRIQAGKVAVTVAGAAGRANAIADAAGLTEDDYQRSGQQYGMTGVMPALGRDSITRARIEKAKNQWARDNGFSPADLVTMQAAYQGDKESLKNFQKQRDQIGAFEQTARKNLDLFLNAASKIPDTGVPWLNTPLRNLTANMIGSENMAAVNAARQVANNEIAKVTSGGGLSGVLSDSARHEVEAYNPQNATFAQTLAVAKILKADMANRMGSMDATLSEIKARIGGGAPKEAGKVEKWGFDASGKLVKQ
jgi:hypothetical protein